MKKSCPGRETKKLGTLKALASLASPTCDARVEQE